MNNLPLLFTGIFLTFASAWFGLVSYSYTNLGHYQPVVSEETGDIAPPPMSGLARQGEKVYAANGCVYCHTQEVRQVNVNKSDILRGWGTRPSVARDYMHDHPSFTGFRRFGPDLSNVGNLEIELRKDKNATWQHLHLYAPQTLVSGSVMPPYRYLYRLQKIQDQPSGDALKLWGADAPPAGWEVVPTPEAHALVAYLMSRKQNYALPEAVEPKLE